MNRILAYSSRNCKELLRDPLNLAFALGFPIIVLLLLSAIQANIPTAVFPIEQITPGIAVFGLSFIALFSGTLIAKDRESAFLTRLYASPMKSGDFICGYVLPLLPLSLLQCAVCFLVALFLGLPFTGNLIVLMLTMIPSALLYTGIGLLAGSLFTDRQVGGVCGALLTNLSAWLSGTWFDLALVGGSFEAIAYCLPFAHATDAGKAALAGSWGDILPHLAWVMGYAIIVLIAAILVFRKKMKA